MAIRKVMLVDDEDDIRTVGNLSLSRVGGWQTVLASSGAEALVKGAAERPDLILLDVMMPGMDGPTTFGRLRAQEATAQTPIIFMTAKIQKQEVARYMELGAAGVIGKPFDPMTLPSEIKKLLPP
jgi:two-component system OmpR family response regulator